MGNNSANNYYNRRIGYGKMSMRASRRHRLGMHGFCLGPKVVSHSMYGTLMPIFEGFVLCFIIIIFFTLFLKRMFMSEFQPCLGN